MKKLFFYVRYVIYYIDFLIYENNYINT